MNCEDLTIEYLKTKYKNLDQIMPKNMTQEDITSICNSVRSNSKKELETKILFTTDLFTKEILIFIMNQNFPSKKPPVAVGPAAAGSESLTQNTYVILKYSIILVFSLVQIIQCSMIINQRKKLPKGLYLWSVSGLTMGLCQLIINMSVIKYRNIVDLFNTKYIFLFGNTIMVLGIGLWTMFVDDIPSNIKDFSGTFCMVYATLQLFTLIGIMVFKFQ